MSVKYSNYVNLTSSSEEQPNKRTLLPPPRKKSLSPPQAPSKSISSKSTHYTSSSSPSESPTPTHVAPPPKLRFVILIKLKPQELPPLQVSPNDLYVQTMDNWPSGPSNPSPPLRVSRTPLVFPNPPPEFKPLLSTQPLFVNINNNTPLLRNNAPSLENIHHPQPNLRNQDFSNPPNILDFVHPNDIPHLHIMFCQCCSTTRHVKEYQEKDKIGSKPDKNEKRNSYVYDPNPNSFNFPFDSYHPPHPTYETYSYNSYGNDSQFGYDCQPQFPLNHESEPGYNENYTFYPYDSSSLPQQYLCCTRCEGPHETCQCDQLIFDEPYCKHCGGPHMNYQCQPMNQDSYNSNSLGFDQPQPPHNLEYRDEIKIVELTENFNGMSIEIQKKEKLLQKEQLAYLSTHPLKRFTSFCYDDDDDEDYTSAITPNEPVLSTEEPDNSLSMGDEHLDTISTTESDEFIKSGVENLILITSESEGIPEHMCDVPSHDNSPPLDVSKDQVEDFSESNEEFSSIDDDSFSIDDIDYVEASHPDFELVSSEVMKIVIPEVGGIDDDILLTIKDDILSKKLLNFNLLIAKIEALNANPTPSSDCKTNSPSTPLNSLLEETNTFDNSLPEFETFCFNFEEISSGSTTTTPDISLPEYEAFHDDPVKEISSGSPTTHSDSSLYASFIFDLSINPFPPADRSDFYEFTDELIPFISPPEYDCFFSRLNQSQGISPRMWWRIFLQQKNHKFLILFPPIPPFN
nr:hypothetical protein [Tanacetum cinerariifolium]